MLTVLIKKPSKLPCSKSSIAMESPLLRKEISLYISINDVFQSQLLNHVQKDGQKKQEHFRCSSFSPLQILSWMNFFASEIVLIETFLKTLPNRMALRGFPLGFLLRSQVGFKTQTWALLKHSTKNEQIVSLIHKPELWKVVEWQVMAPEHFVTRTPLKPSTCAVPYCPKSDSLEAYIVSLK